MKTLDPDYLALKQVSKVAEGSDNFLLVRVFKSNFVFTWLIAIVCVCVCACACACVVNENQA